MIAAYKDEHGQCHLKNARCTHLLGRRALERGREDVGLPVSRLALRRVRPVLNGPAPVDLDDAPAEIEAPVMIPLLDIGEEA